LKKLNHPGRLPTMKLEGILFNFVVFPAVL
jgi:hypothetical protein